MEEIKTIGGHQLPRGADGGHYTPVVTQTAADTMTVEFQPSKAGMAAVEPVEIKLPVGSGDGSGQNPTQSKIEVLEADPIGSELFDGRIWLLRSGAVEAYVTAPVISLGGKTETSITIALNNASYDEAGTIVTSYKVYLDDTLVETVALSPGASYTFTGLTAGTAYAIKVCGVDGELESPASNVLSVTTEPEDTGGDPPDVEMGDVELTDVVYLKGYTAFYNATTNAAYGGLALQANGQRMVTVAESGANILHYQPDGTESPYYLIPMDASAVAITVECAGLMFGVNGFTYDGEKYAYLMDSGWKASGTTVEFTSGKFAYLAIVFKNDTANVTDYDTSTIKVYVRKPVTGG